MEKPYTGRAIFNEDFDGAQITIPVKRNWFVVLFLGAWLGGWFMGEIFALGALLGIALTGSALKAGPASPFIFFWLAAWTVGGFFAFRFFLWNLFGKEIVTLGQGELKIEKKGVPFSKSKSYDLKEAKNFRVVDEPNNSGFGTFQKRDFSGLNNGGIIRFDYGMQTVKFGGGIDEAEANFILSKLSAKKILTDRNFASKT